MLVTNIVKKDSKKSIIYINYEKVFELYNVEIKKFSIKINEKLSESSYREIINDILPKRCMERALYLLQSSDKTEADLKNKLKQNTYPEEIITNVIDKLKEYGYIDDYRYSFNYVRYNIKSKSRSKINYDLMAKGVSKDIVSRVFDNLDKEECDVVTLQKRIVQREFEKRKFDFEADDKKLLEKILTSLMRKGFKYDDVMQVYYELKRNSNKII
jgi:regulatory protein